MSHTCHRCRQRPADPTLCGPCLEECYPRTPAYTPGPWRVMPHPYGGQDITIEARTKSGNPLYVARAYNSGILAKSDPEREANARLIAAAPELLAELRATAELLDLYIYGENGDGEPVEMCAFAEREVSVRALLSRLEA